jgi:gamma-glutamyltranspeptidase/glutathione hydrolase
MIRAGLLLALVVLLALPAAAVEAEHGMVVSAQRYASEVGVRILAQGGNAIDAAVAVGYALAVVDPCCGNIGGGGFMTIRLKDGRDTFINFRETAPAAATAAMYLDAAGKPIDALSRSGYRAAGVPGTVMGLERAAIEYGRIARATLLAPALALARRLCAGRADADILDSKRLARTRSLPRSFCGGTAAVEAGDRLVQSDLAASLEAIAQRGSDAFYRGGIAAAVATANAANGGILTPEDFANYRVTEGPPLVCSYRGYRILSAPPPSSGGTTICEILNILEGYDLKALGFRSAQSVRLLVEAMRHAYHDRNTHLGDPAFVRNPLDRLLSKDYAAGIRTAIDAQKATAPAALPAREKAETAHYSVVDGEGNAVAVTYTINGSLAPLDRAGHRIFPQQRDGRLSPNRRAELYGLVREANAIMPAKRRSPRWPRALSSRTAGIPRAGGPRLAHHHLPRSPPQHRRSGTPPQEAVDAPRLHHQALPDRVAYDRVGLDARVITTLTEWATSSSSCSPGVPSIGASPQPVLRRSDPRRPAGAAVGYCRHPRARGARSCNGTR